MSWDRTDVNTPLAEGIEIWSVSARQLVRCPELTVTQRKRHRDLIRELAKVRREAFVNSQSKTDAEGTGALIEEIEDFKEKVSDLAIQIVRIALQRNYPNVTDDDIGEFSPSDLNKALNCAQNGPQAAAQGEVKGAALGIANGATAPATN